MSIVDFDTCTWTDPWVSELPPLGKLLFNYLWTNNHKNLICIYPISLKTVSDELGLTRKQIDDTLAVLFPKVQYDPEHQIVMVINHVKRQFLRLGKLSPKVKIGFEKNLLALPEGHRFIGEFLKRYATLEIPYPYPIDTVEGGYVYPPGSGSGKGKGRDKEKKLGKDAFSEACQDEKFINQVQATFPKKDVAGLMPQMELWLISNDWKNPKTGKPYTNFKSFIRGWVERAREGEKAGPQVHKAPRNDILDLIEQQRNKLSGVNS